MRVILFAAILATSHATVYENSGAYVKLSWHAAVGDVDVAADTCTSVPVTAINLLRLPDKAFVAADVSTNGLDMAGACMNIGATATFIKHQGDAFNTVATHSFFLTKTATPGTISPVVVANFNCHSRAGALAAIPNNAGGPENFGWEGLQTASDCGGSLTIVADVSSGITFITGAGAAGWGMTATMFTAKKHISANLIGPFDDAGCVTLTGGATAGGMLPIVIPTEDAVAAPTSGNETALSTTSPQCIDFSSVATAGSKYMVKASLTSTKSQLVLQYTRGAGTAYTDRNTCTMSTTATQNWVLTFTVGIRGNINYCQEAKKEDDTSTGKYWKLMPDMMSLGAFPGLEDLPSSSSTTTACAPASGLRVSAFMAALIALIAMVL